MRPTKGKLGPLPRRVKEELNRSDTGRQRSGQCRAPPRAAPQYPGNSSKRIWSSSAPTVFSESTTALTNRSGPAT